MATKESMDRGVALQESPGIKREIRPSGDPLFDEMIVNKREVQRPPTSPADQLKVDSIKRERRGELGADEKLEYMMMEMIERGWLGKGCRVMPASEYDREVNKVKMVVIVGGKELALNVVTAKDVDFLRRLTERGIRDLEDGHMKLVKYFRPEEGAEIKAKYMPGVVVGTDNKNTDDLFNAVVKDLEGKGLPEKIDKNGLQIEFLKQIRGQLLYYTKKAVAVYLDQLRRSHKSATLETRIESMRRKLGLAFEKIKGLKLAEGADSAEFQDFMKTVKSLRTELEAQDLEPTLGANILAHTDLIEELNRRANEKSSQGITLPRARRSNLTEKMLEMPDATISYSTS